MFCRYCGNQLPENAVICASCGAAVENQNTVNINPALPYSYQPDSVLQNSMPMKWFKFLIYFEMWASALLNIISGITAFLGKNYGADSDMIYSMFAGLKVADVVFGAVEILFAVYIIYVRFQLAGFKKNAPGKLLIVYAAPLIASAVYLVVFFILVYNGVSAMGGSLFDVVDVSTFSSMVGSIIGTAIMILLTKTYFDKRKHMFVN